MELQTQTREKLGKSVHSLRREGLIPAELYGHGTDNEHIVVRMSEFMNVYKEAGESAIVNLEVNGKKRPVLIYNVQRDPVTDNVRHVDFYQVKMDEKIETDVPLEFVGESAAVKNLGGILNKSLKTLSIESLPKDLPSSISINLNPLDEIDKSIYVKDIELPSGVEAKVSPDTSVVSVSAPREEEAEVTSSEAESIDAVQVEGGSKDATAQEEGEGGTEEKKSE